MSNEVSHPVRPFVCVRPLLRAYAEQCGLDKTGLSRSHNPDIEARLDTLLGELARELEVNEEVIEALQQLESQIHRCADDRLQEVLDMLPLTLRFSLPNGSVGQVYAATPEPSDLAYRDAKLQITNLQGLEALPGMQWDTDSAQISGLPQQDGDFELALQGVLDSGTGHQRDVEGALRLTINPDPKSLWKQLDPDPALPFAKPYEECDQLQSEAGHRLFYASKRGRSHAHVGTHRDDDGRIALAEGGWSILAVADGGGSYELARRGAEIVANQAVEVLAKTLAGESGQQLEAALLSESQQEGDTSECQQRLNRALNQTLITAAYTALVGIVKEAEAQDKKSRDFSTTLLLAAHKPTRQGELVISFWVGDGVLLLYRQGREVQLLGAPDSGEYAGQTRFLDGDLFRDLPALMQRVNALLVPDFTALILATDGVSDPFFGSDAALAEVEKWDALWQQLEPFLSHESPPQAAQQLLAWLDFWSKGNHDDRSIALLLPPLPKAAVEGDELEQADEVEGASETDSGITSTDSDDGGSDGGD